MRRAKGVFGNLSRIEEGELWRQATGGAKHGSVYGFGPQEQATSLGVNISPLPTLSFQRPSICKEDVQAMIQESMLTERRINDERFISGMSYMNDMFTQWSVTHTGVCPPLFVLPFDMVHENDLVVEGDQGVEGDLQDVEGDHQGDDQNDEDYVSDYGSQ
ncbi:hypothetical protein Dimus_027213 [Dionaea muscipula]